MMPTPSRWILVAPLLPLFTLACGRVPGQFQIINNQVPTDGCVVPTDPTVYRGSGMLDLSLVGSTAPSAYLVFPLLENNMPASTGGRDTNEIVLSSFAVDVSLMGTPPAETAALFAALDGDGTGRALLHYQVPWAGTIASGGGKLSATVEAFPSALAAQILATNEIGGAPALTVNLRVRAFGHTAVDDVESDPFDFPVSVCNGCLVGSLQACTASTGATHTGNVCNVAQDDVVDCCTMGAERICPAVVSQ